MGKCIGMPFAFGAGRRLGVGSFRLCTMRTGRSALIAELQRAGKTSSTCRAKNTLVDFRVPFGSVRFHSVFSRMIPGDSAVMIGIATGKRGSGRLISAIGYDTSGVRKDCWWCFVV